MTQIRKVTEKEITDVIKVHNDAFKSFFLTSLGEPFLCVYYKSILKNKKGVLIGAFEHSELVGFLAASTFSKGFSKSLIQTSFLNYLKLGINLFLTNPLSLVRLVKNMTKHTSLEDDDGKYAEILSIATYVKSQGKGYGKHLVLNLEELLKKTKKDTLLSLTTDYYKNEKTISFYKNLGFDILGDFITYPKRRMYRMIKKL